MKIEFIYNHDEVVRLLITHGVVNHFTIKPGMNGKSGIFESADSKCVCGVTIGRDHRHSFATVVEIGIDRVGAELAAQKFVEWHGLNAPDSTNREVRLVNRETPNEGN